jgi:sterol 3beta-glucosyltransferase
VMGKVVVYSMAYRGDVFPYVPIASALARAGHDVVFVVPREFHPHFAGEPFRCAHSGTDFGPVALDERAEFVDRWGTRMGGAVLLRLYFGEFTIPHLDALYAAIDAEVHDADLVVSHPAASLVASMSAEIHDVPVIVGDLFPMLLPSEHTPIAGLPYLGRRATRIMLRMARSRAVDPLSSAKGFREYRARLGLPNDGWNVIDARLSRTSNLGLVPSAYCPVQPDWPAGYRLVGFTPWSGPRGGAISEDVSTFLESHEPPVVVTLGTSAASARPEVFDAAMAALDSAHVPGVFLTSNDDIAARLSAGAGDRHLVRAFVPLEPLLPHARAIVQSGAHGTNSLALIAGLPSVMVPCLFDQVYHARRQSELGTGTWCRRKGRLENALNQLLGDDGYARRARAFAAEIAHEDGIAAVVAEAERLLTGGHPHR